MAYRRKYKSGGVVSGRAEAPPAESVDVLLPPEEPEAPIQPGEDDDAVQRAALATLRAEQLQRAHMQAQQQRPTVEQIIDNAPGLTDHKRAFLKANPVFVTDAFHQQLLAKHYQAARVAGIGDDTPEINKAILDGVARDLEQQRQAASLQLRSDPTPAAAPQPAPPAPAPPPIKRSAPVTAPVSRDVPMISGQRAADMRSITLTAEERAVARNSFTDPNMSPEEKERLYASNKRLMLQRRAAGLLNE
jgi:hypothetical protein